MAPSSSVVVLDALGGTIRETAPGVFDCHYPGRFVTFLLGVPAALSVALAITGMVASLAVGEWPGGFTFSALCFLPAALLTTPIVLRVRRMGRCIVDRQAGELVRLRFGRVIERWPLAQVRLGRSWDFFHRGFTGMHWLTAKVPDGRSLRLGKGPSAQVDRAIAWMMQTRATYPGGPYGAGLGRG